jgi:hypothetical protein
MMMNRFEAKLIVAESIAPDVFYSVGAQYPAGDFVISRAVDGSTISRFSDIVWDISSWHPEGALSNLYFDFWKDGAWSTVREKLSGEARWIIFSLVWLRDGAPFAVTTLENFLIALRAMARFAEICGKGLMDFFCDHKSVREYVEFHCPPASSKTLAAIFSHLSKVEPKLLGFTTVGSKSLKPLTKLIARYTAGSKQTPPIPTRIYSGFIGALLRELRSWEAVAVEAMQLAVMCCNDPFIGRMVATQEKTRSKLKRISVVRPEWQQLASPSLRAYLKKCGHEDSVLGLGAAISEAQVMAKLTIQTFSGMRDGEAGNLPYHCTSIQVFDGIQHRLVNGHTTKLSKKRACWVTNAAGHLAIKIAQQIARAIYDSAGVLEIPDYKAFGKSRRFPLFVAVGYLRLGNGRGRAAPKTSCFMSGRLALDRYREMAIRLLPKIDDADLLELEAIDEHRAWRTEARFQLNATWPLTTHQLRRSLALYAQRSGIVTLQSLRQQLHHLTEAMSRFYSRGSTYAKLLFGAERPDASHFFYQWQSTERESAAVSYAKNVLLTDEKLFGGHAAFVKHRLAGMDGVVSKGSRAETVRLFEKGLISYRETLIGGCTRIGECDSPAVNWLGIECVRNNCANMVGNVKKLAAVIEEQRGLVALLPPASLEYRTENANLAVLSKALEKTEDNYLDGER